MAGKGGGAWKVAYADFVTAMMAFFLVMWIVAQNKPVKEAVAGYFRDPKGNGIMSGKSDSLLPNPPGGPMPNHLQKANKPNAPRGSTERVAKVDPEADNGPSSKPNQRGIFEGNRFAVGTLIRFPEDSGELDDAGRQVLDDLAPDLLGKRFRIEIRGHAAAQRSTDTGPVRDPWDLSYARSVATMRYLAQKGVDPKRIRLSQIAANEPVKTRENVSAKAAQSVVEITMLNEIVNEPGDGTSNGPAPKPSRDKGSKRFAPKAQRKLQE